MMRTGQRWGLVAVLLAAWLALTGSVTIANLLLGLVIASAALYLVRDARGGSEARLPRRRPRILGLAGLGLLFVRELALSAVRVLVTVLRPNMNLKSGMFSFPLSVTSDVEITLLANLITLTPGTLSVDVSADRRTLTVHALDCSDVDQLRRDIADGFERRIMEAFR